MLRKRLRGSRCEGFIYNLVLVKGGLPQMSLNKAKDSKKQQTCLWHDGQAQIHEMD